MKKTLFSAAILSALLFSGCNELNGSEGGSPTGPSNPTEETGESDFSSVMFPLKEGLRWNYLQSGFGTSHVVRNVTGSEKIDGKIWYEYRTTKSSADSEERDWTQVWLLSIDSDGNVLKRTDEGKEIMFLNFNLDSYTYKGTFEEEYIVTVRDGEDYVLENGEKVPTKWFRFDIEPIADEEFDYRIAKGIGIVQERGAWLYDELLNYNF